uniref:Capsid protein n=1 Tax=Cressdnaviricota sp. TaxID=2748378 RepID=A0A6M3YP83_9VIRU|nr:MAG: capsid protein [Cressdnaviricota sp.]
MPVNYRNIRTRTGRVVVSHAMDYLRNKAQKLKARSRRPVAAGSSARLGRLGVVRRSTVSSSASRLSSAGLGHNATVKRGKKRIKVRGRKKVKVSPRLKASIMQVTNNNKVRGYYQDNRIDILDPGQLGGQNSVEQFPRRGNPFAGFLFHYDLVLHAASRLWNNKASNTAPLVTDLGNFDPTSTVIEVTKQWWTFRMRNNSSRRVTYRIYKCQKKNSALLPRAIDAWSQGLTQMVNDGQLIMANPNPSAMHTGPTLSNQFRQAWKAEETKVVLDPGEYHEFSVSGPAMTYRGQDFYEAATYKTVQRQDIQIIVSSNVDMVV